MSDENQTPADAPDTGRATLAGLLLGVVTADEAETEGQDGQAEAQATTGEATDASTAAETPAQPSQEAHGDDEVPIWTGQAEAGRAFKETKAQIKALEDRLARAEAEKAYLAGLAEGRTPQQQAAEQPAKVDAHPKPDPEQFTTDEAYFDALLEWTAQKAVREAEAKFGGKLAALEQQASDQAWADSMARAEIRAGEAWDNVVQWTNHMQQTSPGFAADLNASKDPGAFALKAFGDAYRLATGQPFNPAAVKTPTPSTPAAAPAASTPAAPAPKAQAADPIAALLADPAAKETLLRALAAEKAAQGETPQVPTGPRGVGSGPGAQGVADGLTVEAIRAMNNPQKLAETRAKVFGAWIGDGQDG